MWYIGAARTSEEADGWDMSNSDEEALDEQLSAGAGYTLSSFYETLHLRYTAPGTGRSRLAHAGHAP